MSKAPARQAYEGTMGGMRRGMGGRKRGSMRQGSKQQTREEVRLATQAVQWESTNQEEDDLGGPNLLPSHSEAWELPTEARGKTAEQHFPGGNGRV